MINRDLVVGVDIMMVGGLGEGKVEFNQIETKHLDPPSEMA